MAGDGEHGRVKAGSCGLGAVIVSRGGLALVSIVASSGEADECVPIDGEPLEPSGGLRVAQPEGAVPAEALAAGGGPKDSVRRCKP